jgi:WD40 repeat protein
LASSVGSLIAADHFRRMEAAQRRLADRNGALSRESAAERRHAEEARDQARASQHATELMLADMNTLQGLQAAELGHDREAVLWFAQAAAAADSDPDRRRTNLLRARAWARHVAQPVAALQHPDGVPLLLEFHPGGAHLIATPGPYGGTTVVWDLATEGPVALGAGGVPLTAAAWSPDGRRIAVGSATGVVLYKFPERTELQHVATEVAPTLLRFSPAGDRLAVATGASVVVWDGALESPLTARLVHPAPVLALALTPRGERLVTADDGGDFRVFAIGAEAVTPELTGRHEQFGGRWTVHAPWIDPTGTRLITVTAPAELTWWDLAARARIDSMTTLGAPICHIGSTPDGWRLAVTLENGDTVLLDPTRRQIVRRLNRGRPGMLVSAVRPDGRAVVVAGAHPEAQQWELPAGDWRGAPAVEATGVRAVAFSRDGLFLATAGYENQIRVWELPRPDARDFAVPTEGSVGRGTFSADSRLMLARLRGKSARVYRVAEAAPAGPSLQPDGELVDAAITPGAVAVVTIATLRGGGGLVDFWDWHTGRRRWAPLAQPAEPVVLSLGARGRVAVLCRDGGLRLLDGATGRLVRDWSCGATDQARADLSVSLSPDDRTVLVAINHHLQAWDAATGRLRFDPLYHRHLVFAGLTPDGRSITSAGVDSTLRSWSAATGQPLGPAMIHPSWIDGGMDIHPDSRHVLTICKDMTLRVWDTALGKPAARPITPASIGAARFTPDGQHVISAGNDGTFELWHWRSGRRLAPARKLPIEHDWAFAGNRTVQISPDGHFAAIGGRPDVWILSLADLDPGKEKPPADMKTWAELLSHHRIDAGGALTRLSGEEWLARWRERRHLGAGEGRTDGP